MVLRANKYCLSEMMKEQKKVEKSISSGAIKQKELSHKLTKVNKEASDARYQV